MLDFDLLSGVVRAWGLWSWPERALAAVSDHAWRWAFAIAAVGVGVQQARIDGLVLRPHLGPLAMTLIDVPGWRPRALAAEQALARVRAAQPAAAAAQAAANHQPAALSAAIAKVSDDDAKVYYDKGRAAGAAYAAAHGAGGVRAAPVNRVASHADLPGTDPAAPVDDRSGNPADMVAVSRADFDRLAANSLRLAKVHQDAQSLIAAGVAVEDSR